MLQSKVPLPLPNPKTLLLNFYRALRDNSFFR
jgi:hypothetical protein